MKKKLSFLLAILYTLSSVLPTFAEVKVHNGIDINIENLVSKEIDLSEKYKIQRDLNILELYGQNLNKLVKIEIQKENNIYNIKYSDNITSEISIIENEEGINQLSIVEGDKKDLILIKDNDVYLDNKKIEIVTSEQSIEMYNENMIMPLADRDVWCTKSVPYGKSSDYSKYIGVRTCPSIKLEKMLKNVTRAALITILFTMCSGELGLAALASQARRTALESIAGTIIFSALDYQSDTKYLSSKTYIYYHKNGHYIESKNMYVQKNSTRWYYGRYTKDDDKGPLTTNYVCTRYY